MKKIAILLFVASLSLAAAAKVNNDTTVCFSVEPPMHCANCENKIKSNMRFEKGISKIETSVPDGEVKITYNKTKTTDEKLKAALSKLGYKATPKPAANSK